MGTVRETTFRNAFIYRANFLPTLSVRDASPEDASLFYASRASPPSATNKFIHPEEPPGESQNFIMFHTESVLPAKSNVALTSDDTATNPSRLEIMQISVYRMGASHYRTNPKRHFIWTSSQSIRFVRAQKGRLIQGAHMKPTVTSSR